jgi:hypothetical protein
LSSFTKLLLLLLQVDDMLAQAQSVSRSLLEQSRQTDAAWAPLLLLLQVDDMLAQVQSVSRSLLEQFHQTAAAAAAG